MTDRSPMDDVDHIAEKLIAAAYRRFGAGDDYITAVIGNTDVPAYFRCIAKLAALPRAMNLYEQYQQASGDLDADMVMNAGLDSLLTDAALPPDQRRVIEQIKALRAWALDVTHELTRAAEQAVVEELR
ncbi:MAG: hypothetical protein JO166_20790 [Deltaproteobacteria bacterium]|nr:hypothetical protein [Deltaproteobacteria bacterium]